MKMRRAPLALCALLFACPAGADDAEPLRSGYAFDYPRVLVQQQLFGLAHGAGLLAAACGPMHAEAAAAHSAWLGRQQAAVEALRADLGRYYFNDPDVDARAIAQALRLPEALDTPPDELEAACATLSEALARPRYDFATRFRLEEKMAQLIGAAEVDALHEHCRKLFDPGEQKVHEARYRLWREINDPAVDAAAEALEREWPAEGPAETYGQWIDSVRNETRGSGDHAACAGFSAWLKRPESFLRNVFRMPPAAETK